MTDTSDSSLLLDTHLDSAHQFTEAIQVVAGNKRRRYGVSLDIKMLYQVGP